jgi:hypothetical protein
MPPRSLPKPVVLLSTGLLLLTGCVVGEAPSQPPPPVVAPPPPVAVEPLGPPLGTDVVVVGPPPPVYQERMTVSPGVGFVWIPGWVWGRGSWVWAGGRWARPPRPDLRWVAPRYVYRGGRHLFIHGGWR